MIKGKIPKIGLVVFYGISTFVGYLMQNPVLTYIRHMVCKEIVGNILKQATAYFFLHTVK